MAKNFGVSQEHFATIPVHERYIFQSSVPGSLTSDRVSSSAGLVPQSFSCRLFAQEGIRTPGGTVRVADSSNFTAASTIVAVLVEVEPGAMRKLHWHPNNDEWQYCIEGQARMSVFASDGKARTFDYQAGDVGYVPFAMGHYVENTGDTPMRYLELFKRSRYADVSLNQWMALTPHELVQAHLNLDQTVMGVLCKEKRPVV